MDFANKWDFRKRLNIRYLKGNNRRNNLVYEHILAKSRAYLKMCNIHIVAEDYQNHTLRPTPKKKKEKKKKEILNIKTKKLLKDGI